MTGTEAHLGRNVVGKPEAVTVCGPGLQHEQRRLNRRQDVLEQHAVGVHKKLLLLLQVFLHSSRHASHRQHVLCQTTANICSLLFTAYIVMAFNAPIRRRHACGVRFIF